MNYVSKRKMTSKKYFDAVQVASSVNMEMISFYRKGTFLWITVYHLLSSLIPFNDKCTRGSDFIGLTWEMKKKWNFDFRRSDDGQKTLQHLNDYNGIPYHWSNHFSIWADISRVTFFSQPRSLESLCLGVGIGPAHISHRPLANRSLPGQCIGTFLCSIVLRSIILFTGLHV